jgi:Fructose-bisphosphate aldolase class-II
MLDEDERHFKKHGEPLFSSHMIDLSEEPVAWNIQTTAQYLKRAAPMKQWLEMVGIQPFLALFITPSPDRRLMAIGNRHHGW